MHGFGPPHPGRVDADAAVVDRRRGPLGPLMREQLAAGRIPVGIADEDVVVVRAVAPDWDL